MYGWSVIGTAAVVQPMKRIIGRERPNGSNFHSFPSGHTSTAFAAAEFLNQEYGRRYPWISIAGYATAGLTAYLRMYNDQHWLGDVIAGAAIGMGTTKLIYWIREKTEQKKKRSSRIP
jgi:membrane-associated phospholipid phosphatase